MKFLLKIISLFSIFLKVFQVLHNKSPVLNTFTLPIVDDAQKLFSFILTYMINKMRFDYLKGVCCIADLYLLLWAFQNSLFLISDWQYVCKCIFFILCEILMIFFNVKSREGKQLIHFGFLTGFILYLHLLFLYVLLSNDFFLNGKTLLFVVHL